MEQPLIDTRADLAKICNTTEKKLNYICFRLPDSAKFRSFDITKKNGDNRTVFAPSPPLLALQRHLLPFLYARFTPRTYVTGFVPTRSIVDNGMRHRSRAIVINIDIQDFFGSIHFGRSRGALMSKPINFGKDAATATARLCHYDGKLAAGCPISPIISNLVARRLDTAYRRLSTGYKLRYSRYADDMTFSGGRKEARELQGRLLEEFLEKAEQIAARNGFALNAKKTRIRNASQRQQITGLVTNKKLNVPRTFVRELRSLLHYADSGQAILAAMKFHGEEFDTEEEARAYLTQVVSGKLAFMRYVRSSDPLMAERQAWQDDLYWNYLSRANNTFGCYEDEFLTMWYERARHPTTGTRYRPYEVCEMSLRMLLQRVAKGKWPTDWVKQVLSLFDAEERARVEKDLAKLKAKDGDLFHALTFGDIERVVDSCWNELEVALTRPIRKKALTNRLQQVLPWRNAEGHLRPAHLRDAGAELKAVAAANQIMAWIPDSDRQAAREHLEGMSGS